MWAWIPTNIHTFWCLLVNFSPHSLSFHVKILCDGNAWCLMLCWMNLLLALVLFIWHLNSCSQTHYGWSILLNSDDYYLLIVVGDRYIYVYVTLWFILLPSSLFIDAWKPCLSLLFLAFYWNNPTCLLAFGLSVWEVNGDREPFRKWWIYFLRMLLIIFNIMCVVYVAWKTREIMPKFLKMTMP